MAINVTNLLTLRPPSKTFNIQAQHDSLPSTEIRYLQNDRRDKNQCEIDQYKLHKTGIDFLPSIDGILKVY